MIFNFTKGYTPQTYYESRDYRVLLKLLGIVMTDHKYNIDHLLDLYNAMYCPEDLLELLSGMVGYDYDPSLTISHLRLIIKYFPYLLRERGSEIGIKLAMALSLNTHDGEEKPALEDIDIQVDRVHGIIKLYYPDDFSIKKNLLEYVRPVGMVIREYGMTKISSTNEINIKATAKGRSKVYGKEDATVGRSQLGFDENYKEDEEEDES